VKSSLQCATEIINLMIDIKQISGNTSSHVECGGAPA